MASNREITPVEFLLNVFPSELLLEGEKILVGHPASFTDRDTGEVVNYHKQMYFHPRSGALRQPQGWLYCVSTVGLGDKPRRRLEDVRHAFVLPCDDVGTKSKTPPVDPSYILETSPGNYQYGYLIDPYKVSTGAGAARYDACLVGLAQAGYNDPGCRSASRMIKLPGAVHSSGFITRVVDWQPALSWDLDKLMAEMGVEPCQFTRAQRKKRLKPGMVAEFDQIDDPVLDWLVENDFVFSHNDEWVHIRCPWEHEHSSDTGPSSTSFSPLEYGTATRGFKCLHGHCAHRRAGHLLTWVAQQGGPGIAPQMKLCVPDHLRQSA